ncbi:MAG: hypothetical protein H6631_13540 [Anaerolineaceae bacterium]|nr:hypothetical protein [Anaerolineaceae bacterium]
MALQNRVDPFGNIHAVEARGTCLGNRGILHDDHRHLIHYHRHQAWIICQLEFKGRRRTPMTPGTYTELFFLDEATALAAGHRPCAECNRPRYNEFKQRWQQAHPDSRDAIDAVLHRARFVPRQPDWRQKKRTYVARLDELPDGAFITLDGSPKAVPFLVWAAALHRWQFDGYGDPIPRPTDQMVTVLTPEPTVRTLAAGYRPDIHLIPLYK